jgi:penicillin-binding protein 1B
VGLAIIPVCALSVTADSAHCNKLASTSPEAAALSRSAVLIDFAGRCWTWLRAPFWLGLGTFLGFVVPYAVYLDGLVRARFAEIDFAEPSRVYARPLVLRRGLALNADALVLELRAARYREVAALDGPGSYRQDGADFELATRAFRSPRGPEPARRLRLRLASGKVDRVLDLDTGAALDAALIDPARIATLYGQRQEERRFVRVNEIPPLLISTLQAVEDRNFKHHRGVDPWGIARALWVNLTAGEVVQGGSTLTQQLVRNLFLDRSQTLTRKLNEALLALLIELHFGKDRILEAYLNEVYLGQQGGQAVHGVAAAAEFYFGRDLAALEAAEIALLVGLIQGPSLHDPRRFPERAKARRDLVLGVMQQTGLINAMDREVAQRRALGVSAAGALPRNRYPAFLDLVREQLKRDFPDSVLRSEGLAVLTTLAPATQVYAERAIAERMKALGKAAQGLEAAVVVTQAQSGAIEAVVGAREADRPGFNRAVLAARPIGSLVKPFVYLVALAQPQAFSLMTQIEDRKLSLRLPNGQVWSPDNIDGVEHGSVALIDALARSYNLATVRLGLEVTPGTVERVLEALIPGADVSPHPSLLLGATELSPLQVAQAYQYLAGDGRPIGLYALEAVLDVQGRPLTRHAAAPAPGDLVSAARLVSFALQETARRGTAHALVGLGLGKLSAAGKTGTSNDQRDSWFAGYTGSHLAVVWLGTDDNKATGLYGATGALRVWAALFAKLPSAPLQLPLSEDPQLRWVDTPTQMLTDAECPGARQLPFIRGYEPFEFASCLNDPITQWFRGELGQRERDWDRGRDYQSRRRRGRERDRYDDNESF